MFHLGKEAKPFLENIRRFSFVQDVKSIGNKLLVKLDDPEQQNPLLVQTLVDAGAHIQFVGEIRYSLEDIYLTLMKE